MRRKGNKKAGFTLVEVIVVLVILAILAAIMIPAMTGWIDKAREKSVIVEARTALLAAQTLFSEAYAANLVPSAAVSQANVKELAGLQGTPIVWAFDASTYQITYFSYQEPKTQKWAVYKDGNWTVGDNYY